MSLIRWNPEVSFPSLPSYLDTFFGTNFDGFFNNTASNLPAVNVVETKEAFRLDVAAPGFKKEDFKVEERNGYLNISAENSSEKEEEEKEGRYARREWRYNSFSRSFALPDNVKGEAIEAKYEGGVLHVTLPKSKAEEPLKTGKLIAVG